MGEEQKQGGWEAKLGLVLSAVTGIILFAGMGVFGVLLLGHSFRASSQVVAIPETVAATTPATAPESGGGDGAGTGANATEATAEPADPEFAKLMETGKQTYQLCAACHGPVGVSIAAAMAPNLTSSEWVTGSAERLAMILLKGVQPEGRYQGVMIGWGPQLSDEQIAGVLTYIRNSFGHSAEKITPELIGEVRAEYSDRSAAFTRAELEELEEVEG